MAEIAIEAAAIRINSLGRAGRAYAAFAIHAIITEWFLTFAVGISSITMCQRNGNLANCKKNGQGSFKKKDRIAGNIARMVDNHECEFRPEVQACVDCLLAIFTSRTGMQRSVRFVDRNWPLPHYKHTRHTSRAHPTGISCSTHQEMHRHQRTYNLGKCRHFLVDIHSTNWLSH